MQHVPCSQIHNIRGLILELVGTSTVNALRRQEQDSGPLTHCVHSMYGAGLDRKDRTRIRGKPAPSPPGEPNFQRMPRRLEKAETSTPKHTGAAHEHPRGTSTVDKMGSGMLGRAEPMARCPSNQPLDDEGGPTRESRNGRISVMSMDLGLPAASSSEGPRLPFRLMRWAVLFPPSIRRWDMSSSP